MGQNEQLELTTGGDVENAARMVAQDDNDDADNGDYSCDDGDRDASDEHPVDSERDADTRCMSNVELDKDLSLCKMVLRLCSVCANFFRGRFRFTEAVHVKMHHSSLLSLEESADGGCPHCQELSKVLERYFETSSFVKENPDLSIWFGPQKCSSEPQDQRGLRITLYLCWQDEQSLGDDCCPDGYCHVKDLFFYPADILGIGPEFRDIDLRETTANSDRSIDLARSWYKECLEHSSCQKWEKTSIALPTRLVQVQMLGHGASSRLAAKVCETKNMSPDVTCRYTTLSHRWGDGIMPKLKESNIGTLRREIPIEQLSPILKDAMYMTYKLDIEYIWIDCLCIIQGSKRDWELEATRMGDYYRYAQFNISASGYEGSSQGLFPERIALPFLNYPIRPDFILVEDEDGEEIQTRYDEIYIRVDPSDFNDVIYGPLASRGWVAQERALSPGILHFTPRQMWWECTEHVVSEAFPTIKLPWESAQDYGAGALRSINATSSPAEIYNAWRGFVSHYASTNLTFETDRFPAVAGIARVYNGLLDDNFVAGIWEGDLVRSLLWKPHDKKARKIPSTKMAPSWSWASLPIRHQYPPFGSPVNGIRFEILSDVPNFESDLHTTTFEKSSVRGLAMTGPLRRISVELWELPHWTEFARHEFAKCDVDYPHYFSEQDTAGQEWRWEDFTHILPLWKSDSEYVDGEVIVDGLLLQRAPATELRDTFRRLGTFGLYFRSDELCDKYLGLVKENGSYMPSVGFEECGLQDFVLI